MFEREKGDICRIAWQDPETDSGWFEDEMPDLDVVISVGIYLGENDTTIWFASTYHRGTQAFADRMTYPKGCILHVETIGKA